MSVHRQISFHAPANLPPCTGKSTSTHRQTSLHAPANLPPRTGKSPSTHRQISFHAPANLFPRTGNPPSTHRQISLHAPANLPPRTGKSLSTPANRLARLNDEFVRNGFEEGGLVVLGPDDVGGSWAYGLPLEVGHGGSVLLALASGRVVAFHAVQEILSAAGMPG